MAMGCVPNEGGIACIRLRGLPFTASYQDVLSFFGQYTVLDVLISKTGGKPNGQGYVLLGSQAEAQQACAELNNQFIGKRYIEVFPSTMADFEAARRMSEEHSRAASSKQYNTGLTSTRHQPAAQQQPAYLHKEAATVPRTLMMQPVLQLRHEQQATSTSSNVSNMLLQQLPQQANDAVAVSHYQMQQYSHRGSQHKIVRLRGLPFSATVKDIAAFLAPIELPDGAGAIRLARHPDLRPTGEAYVILRNDAELTVALQKHKNVMGKRYIEVFASCFAAMQQGLARTLLPPLLVPAVQLPWETNATAVPSTTVTVASSEVAEQQILLTALQQQQQQQQQQQLHNLVMQKQSAVQPTELLQPAGVLASSAGLVKTLDGCIVAGNVAAMLTQQQQHQAAISGPLAAAVLPPVPLMPGANYASAAGAVPVPGAPLNPGVGMAAMTVPSTCAVISSCIPLQDTQCMPGSFDIASADQAVQYALMPMQQQRLGALHSQAPALSLMTSIGSGGGLQRFSQQSSQQRVSSSALDILGCGGCLELTPTAAWN